MAQKNHNQKDHFEHNDEGIEDDGIGIGRKTKTEKKKTNYAPYIIGGVILLAILAAIIF